MGSCPAKGLEPLSAAIYPQAWLGRCQWRQMTVAYAEAGPDPSATAARSTVVLIHGFGANKEHWRHTMPALATAHRVVAIDLIGFGASDKPRSRLKDDTDACGWTYGIDSWSEQLLDFLDAHSPGPIQLVGNSIGGVVALNTARLLERRGQAARQVILIDCAQRTLDDKQLAQQPLLSQWFRPALKALVRQRWLTSRLFKTVTNVGAIRRVLKQAYPSGANVDAQLIDLLLQPALAPNAEEAFRGFINLFNDHLAPQLLAELQTPVALIHGALDPWERVSEAARWREFCCVRSLDVVEGLGHCPHDEGPDIVNPILLRLLQEGDRLAA